MLKEWVKTGENASQCESNFVLRRRDTQRHHEGDECLTVQEMIDRKIPIEKIRAVVSRGGGVPDADCPGLAKLTAYWINTSKARSREKELTAEAEMRVQARGAGALDHMDVDLMGTGSASAPSDIDTMLATATSSAATPCASAGGGSLVKTLSKSYRVYAHVIFHNKKMCCRYACGWESQRKGQTQSSCCCGEHAKD